MAIKKRTPGTFGRASGQGAGNSSSKGSSFPKRTPGKFGRTGGPPAGRAGVTGGKSSGRMPYNATPGKFGRTGTTGPLGSLKAKPYDANNPTGPEKIMSLRAANLDDNKMSPGNSVVSYAKTVTGLHAGATMGVSNKKK